MTRDEIKQQLRDVSKPSTLDMLEEAMEKISTEHLHWCYDTYESRKEMQKAEMLIGLQVNSNNTIDVKMEDPDGRFYGVSLSL